MTCALSSEVSCLSHSTASELEMRLLGAQWDCAQGSGGVLASGEHLASLALRSLQPSLFTLGVCWITEWHLDSLPSHTSKFSTLLVFWILASFNYRYAIAARSGSAPYGRQEGVHRAEWQPQCWADPLSHGRVRKFLNLWYLSIPADCCDGGADFVGWLGGFSPSGF